MLPDMSQLNWTNVVEKSQNGSFGEIFDNIVACGQKSVTRQVTIKLDKSWWKMSTCLIWWFFDKIVACGQKSVTKQVKIKLEKSYQKCQNSQFGEFWSNSLHS